MLEYKERPAVLEFLSGLLAGIGIIILTWLLTIFMAVLLESLPHFSDIEIQFSAVLWVVLAFALGVFAFLKRDWAHRRSSFSAGLLTSVPLLLLLASACWSFSGA